ncbi:MAG: cytochrome c [Chloroflexota bacterium]
MLYRTMNGLIAVVMMAFLMGCGGQADDSANTEVGSATEETTPEVEMTEEATAEATASLTLVAPEPTAVESGITPAEAVITANVDRADAENGALLYNENLVPTCVTCHLADSSQRQVGPGLVNYSEVAGTRVEGQGAFTYAYNSIRYANMHVVEGYQEGLMPVYDGILTDQEVYDLIAYIWTLEPEE